MPEGSGVTFEVTRGLHGGAKLNLDDGPCTIGSSIDCDIVLKDAGIAPTHVRLRRKGGQIELDAVGGDINLPGGQVVPMGHGRRFRLPLTVTVGSAEIRLGGDGQPQVGPAVTRRSGVAAAALMVAAIAVLIVWNNFSVAQAERSNQEDLEGAPGLTQLASLDGTGQDIVGSIQGGQQETSRPVSATLGQAEQQLRSHLDQSGLGQLDIRSEPGRLIASGTVAKELSAAWTNVQAWFDQTYGGNILLVSNVAIVGVGDVPRLALQAIWYGDKPYIIAADGARYYEGAFIDDGWAIKQISETSLLLVKEGATIALKYQ